MSHHRFNIGRFARRCLPDFLLSLGDKFVKLWKMRTKKSCLKDKSADIRRIFWDERLGREVNRICFDYDRMPFTPHPREVIYIENECNEPVNSFIRKHLREIREGFAQRNFTFVYLPAFTEDPGLGRRMPYYNPSGEEVADSCHLASDFLLPYVADNTRETFVHGSGEVGPAFIRRRPFHHIDIIEDGEERTKVTVFSYMPVPDTISMEMFEAMLQRYPVKDSATFFAHPAVDHSPYDADRRFPEEVEKLMEDVRKKIDELRAFGVSEMAIRRLCINDRPLSRLHITASYRILLPDYGGMEITMEPLPKAVFLLFLRHPEGILFKRLIDHRSELVAIYQGLTGRISSEGIQRSIDDIVNPTKNSINEKCARIREAFLKHFDEELACNYFITGERSSAKTILLDRSLVEWDDM